MKELKFILKNGATETELQHSPDGWDSALIEVDRDPKFLGVLRSFTVELKFVLEGAEMLRDIFYNKIQNETFLTVQKLSPVTLVYSDVYTGQVDFSTFTDTANNVGVKLTDLSLSNIVKRNFEVNYLTLFLSNLDLYFNGEFGPNPNSIDAIKFSTFLGHLFEKVTEGRYSSGEFGLDVSALTTLENGISTVYYTNAVALMGARLDRLEISLSDFLKEIFIFFKLTFSIEVIAGKETLKLRPVENSFPEAVFSHVDSISNFKVTVAKDYIYDSVSVGYPEQNYDDETNTSREIGTTSVFTNKNAFVASQPLELVSSFRGDTIGINYWQSIYGGILDNLDYSPFVVHAEQNIVFNKKIIELGFVGTTNPPTEKVAYNTEISPKRLYKLHEKFINSCYYGSDLQTEIITAKLNTANLYTQPHDFDPVEFEGEGITRTETPFFLPIYFEFDGIFPDSIDLPALYNPLNSRLTFDYNGETFAGFVVNIKTGLTGKKKATFKLLSAPENDLTKLIR